MFCIPSCNIAAITLDIQVLFWDYSFHDHLLESFKLFSRPMTERRVSFAWL